MTSFRLAVLKIDRSRVLPLHYEYDETISSYRTLGYVRLSSLTLPGVTYLGPDTPAARDDFLTQVLVGLTIPRDKARQIVRDAEHPGAAPDVPAAAAGGPQDPPPHQVARNGDWELARVPGRQDFWRLTNIGAQQLFPVDAIFVMSRDERRWSDEVGLGITVPVLGPGGSTQMHIVGADHVTDVIVHWRRHRPRFSRIHEWVIRF